MCFRNGLHKLALQKQVNNIVSSYSKKIILSAIFFFFTASLLSQDLGFKKFVYAWPTSKPDLSKQTTAFNEQDLVIIDEHVFLDFLNGRTIRKNCIFKINNEKGLKKFSSIILPESFDVPADNSFLAPRFSGLNTPFIYEFKINYFAARKLNKTGRVENCDTKVSTKKIYWITNDGDHMQDFNYHFTFPDIQVGDIIEYTYEINFRGGYGFDLFYFHSTLPKQNSQLEIKAFAHSHPGYEFICNIHIPDSSFHKKKIYTGPEGDKWQYTYSYNNLTAINYPSNNCVGKQFPHLFIDYSMRRGPHFEWRFNPDEVIKYQTLYTSKYAALRKLIAKIPKTDSSSRSDFLNGLNKELNELKFVTAESMNYSQTAPQYAVKAEEWLIKGKLVEEFMTNVYQEIFQEAQIPYKLICLHDKRLGELKNYCRAESKYERWFFAIPDKENLIYLLQRNRGIKYHINELPFYYEGVPASLFVGVKYSHADTSDFYKQHKFIRTHSSNEHENVRTENALFKVNLDSSSTYATIKESLNGQFSTLLRHLYLNDPIDSTIHPVYFKKCVSKPNSIDKKISISSRSDYFPFKYTFNCSEKITIPDKKELSLKD